MKRLHKIPDNMPIIKKIDLLKQLAKDGNIPEVLSGQDGLDILMYKFLGDNYYIVDPVSEDQGNSIVVMDIISHHNLVVKNAFFSGAALGGAIVVLLAILLVC